MVYYLCKKKLEEKTISNAVEFMREYLGGMDNRYEEVSGLFYDALRHGYIHLATPKRVELQDKKILDFPFICYGWREDYLKVAKMRETQSTGSTVEIYRISLDLPLPYKDLLSATDKYAEDIRHNQALADIFRKTFENSPGTRIYDNCFRAY